MSGQRRLLYEGTRAVVTGGRHYADRALVYSVLDALLEECEGNLAIATGGATGADELAEQWCAENERPPVVFKITDEEWRLVGRAAGPARNRRMIKRFDPHLVVAFPGGLGTRSCITIAKKLQIEVRRYS